MNKSIYDWIDDDTVKPILDYVNSTVGLIQCNYISDAFDDKMITFIKYGILYTIVLKKDGVRYSKDMFSMLSGLEIFIISLYRDYRIDRIYKIK